jgi:GalNAc-alpha-(1->4)-GalNAc-alpha-(1->3)-diNAcBac-PP-undecaprenol alpha-1,4-N-acetyl-D-galactosaminyltransferase
MKTITIITPSLGAGGIERVVSDLSNYLIKTGGFKVNIICFGSKEIFYHLDSAIKIYILPKSRIRALTFVRKLLKLRSIIKTLQPNASISFGSMYNSFFLLSCIGLPGRKFVSDRSNPWRNSRLVFHRGGEEYQDGFHHYVLKKILYRHAHKILAQTLLSVDIEQRNFGKKKVLYFPNPIKPASINFESKKKIILNVGRFVPSKQQKKLLKIFSQIKPKVRENWRLVFVGGGEDYFTQSKELAQNLGIKGEVDFIGYSKNVEDWYHRASIFAFTSSSEGFPNALGEAMAHGCACISYDCVAGPADLINNGINGVLVPVGDEIRYRHELVEFLTNSQLRESYQRQAQLVSETFKFEKIVQKLIDEII